MYAISTIVKTHIHTIPTGVNPSISCYATFSFATWPCALRAPNLLAFRASRMAFRTVLKNLTQLFAQLTRSPGKPYDLRAEAQ